VVVAVTWTETGADPFSGTEFSAGVQVARAGAPLQLSETDCANPLTGARSTVKIAVCPGTTVRLMQLVVSEKLCTVPVIATVCGLEAALSVTLSDAVAGTPPGGAVVGVKVTLMVQLEPAASEEPHVLLSVNSLAFVPVNPIEVIRSAALPLLVSVTD
jgi:hypothetical protein